MIVCLLSNLQSDYFVNLHSFPAVPLSSLVLLVRVTVFFCFFCLFFYLFICVLFLVLYYITFLIIFLILFFFTFSVD